MLRGLLVVRAALLAALVVSSLTACRGGQPDRTVVAFLLASDTSPRWTQFDEPAFAERVKSSCPDCVYLTKNAQGDPERQAEQFADVMEHGADVVVLNAVTSDLGEELVTRAGKVPVIAYDRFVAGADYFVSYDAGEIGTEQAQAVVDRIGEKGSVLLVNGPQTDPNAVSIKQSVHRELRRADTDVVAELDPRTWSGDEAQAWVSRELRRHPARSLDAIVAANDSQADGVVAALRDAGVRDLDWPVVTGQDADLDALQRIVLGEQTLTVFKSFPRQAQQAADMAVTLVTGGRIHRTHPFEGVPSVIFDPEVVDVANLTDTVVRDGVYTQRQLCRGSQLRERCMELGIL